MVPTKTRPSLSLYRTAFLLALFTILYNVVEGMISTYLGAEDESLALFGFGMDSFIEVISGFGIAHMILRIQNNPDSPRGKFERGALQITGTAFYLLVLGLVLGSTWTIWNQEKPETTVWGVIIALISIAVMWALVVWKKNIGTKLNSAPLLADANCTKVCLYMSGILLISSGLYELFGVIYLDSLGALGLAYFAFKEGKECFQKANSSDYCQCH